jgi:hypothetical protein
LILGTLGGDAKEALPGLFDLARDIGRPTNGVIAAIDRIDSGAVERFARESVPVLTETVVQFKPGVPFACLTLTNLGRHARSALPALRPWAVGKTVSSAVVGWLIDQEEEGQSALADVLLAPMTDNNDRNRLLSDIAAFEKPFGQTLVKAVAQCISETDAVDCRWREASIELVPGCLLSLAEPRARLARPASVRIKRK